jgi:hypothetical protein
MGQRPAMTPGVLLTLPRGGRITQAEPPLRRLTDEGDKYEVS